MRGEFVLGGAEVDECASLDKPCNYVIARCQLRHHGTRSNASVLNSDRITFRINHFSASPSN